jgi:hypothetical protein
MRDVVERRVVGVLVRILCVYVCMWGWGVLRGRVGVGVAATSRYKFGDHCPRRLSGG